MQRGAFQFSIIRGSRHWWSHSQELLYKVCYSTTSFIKKHNCNAFAPDRNDEAAIG